MDWIVKILVFFRCAYRKIKGWVKYIPNSNKELKNPKDIGNSSTFRCVCRKMEGWVTDGKITKPCPNCGRIYRGRYDLSSLQIIALEISDK